MKRGCVLILVALISPALAACGGSLENGSLQNEPSGQSGTVQAEITPDAASIPGTSVAPQPAPAPQSKLEPAPNEGETIGVMPNISITVGNSVFSVELYDNSAARALLAQFPLTLNMSDLNGNEKYYYLDNDLPSDSTENPATMNAGDLMCWSGNCLVLFYKSFPNSYGGYVRLGHIEDASGLAAALGSGSAEVTFAVSN